VQIITAMTSEPSISVVVPVFREAETINSLILTLKELAQGGSLEIIVVDGSPEAETVRAIDDDGVIRKVSGRGRGRQMNGGASCASGEVLLFLHADTRLPSGALGHVRSCLGDSQIVAGAFDLGIDSKRWGFRVIEYVASVRSRLTRIPYGDQAIFIRRNYFEALGGYRDIPLMEDVDLMRRIRKKGDRICFISQRVRTSPRRWEREGILYTTLRNWTLVTLFLFGVEPERLVRFYR